MSRLLRLRRSNGAATHALRSVGARAITLPMQAAASLLVAGILIREYGAHAYAQYALVVSLAAVLPFADLGIGAAIVNATADMSSQDKRIRAILVIRSALRALVLIALISIAVSSLITFTFGWAPILGDTFETDGNMAILFCISLFACALPFSVGQRVALGIGMNGRQLLVQGFQPLITLVLVVACVSVRWDVRSAFLCFFIAYFVTSLITTLAADRWSGGLICAAVNRRVVTPGVRGKEISIFSTALPMCVVMVGLPLVLQTHRVMLSHFGTPDQLAQYSLAAQMYLPVVALVSAASTSLWSVFARERSVQEGAPVRASASPMPFSVGISLAALAFCIAITMLVPFLAPAISGGRINVSITIGACFSVFIVAQAAQAPLGVYLTDVRGLRLQAITTIVFVATVWLIAGAIIPSVGAGAPVLITGIAGMFIQVAPFMIAIKYSRRHEHSGRSMDATRTVGGSGK